MTEYKLMYGEPDEIAFDEKEDAIPFLCDCCGYPAPLAVFRRYGNYCEVCSQTYLSRIGGENRVLARSIGYIGNMILEEIRKQK